MSSLRLLPLLALLTVSTACKTDYNRITVSKMKDLVGDQFDSHRWFSSPTDNFGVGTAFASRERFAQQVSICDSAYCLGVTPTDFSQWLDLGGFAGVGNAGPTITLSTEEKTKLNAS